MHEQQSFAYSLSQDGERWVWRVYDLDGQAVASGQHASRESAQAAVKQSLDTGPAQIRRSA